MGAHWHAKQFPIFEHLTVADVGRIEACSRMRTFASRSPIRLPAQVAEHVFLLVTGLVKVCHLNADGKESILTFVEPGELFGELAILGGDDPDEYIEAASESTVIMIPTDELFRLVEAYPDVSLQVTKLVGLRRQRIERRLRNLLFVPHRDRLVHLLLDLADQFGVYTPRGIKFRIKLSHQELANLIGSTRESVTIALGELRIHDLIEVGRRNITITNLGGLAQTVGRRQPRLDSGCTAMLALA